MTASIPMIVSFGAGTERTETRVVVRSVTAPRRRTVLTHWVEQVDAGLVRRHGTQVLDIPFWVGESLETATYNSYIYTHVLFFRTDPGVAPPDSTLVCWSAGHTLGHGLGSAGTCLGHRDAVVRDDVSFWNTSFDRIFTVARARVENGWAPESLAGTAIVRPAEWQG